MFGTALTQASVNSTLAADAFAIPAELRGNAAALAPVENVRWQWVLQRMGNGFYLDTDAYYNTVRLPAERRRKAPIDLLLAASRLRHRPYRALHSLIPPLRLMNSANGSLSSFSLFAYRSTLLHLLRVRLSVLAGSAVHRMMAVNTSSRGHGSSPRKRRARRARSTSHPSADHQLTKS
jgi:hypothetical protein